MRFLRRRGTNVTMTMVADEGLFPEELAVQVLPRPDDSKTRDWVMQERHSDAITNLGDYRINLKFTVADGDDTDILSTSRVPLGVEVVDGKRVGNGVDLRDRRMHLKLTDLVKELQTSLVKVNTIIKENEAWQS